MNVKDLINSSGKHEFIFFWGNTEKSGKTTKACLSQWYECKFKVDGVEYSSAEQFMMAEKARVMGDDASKNEILSTHNPRDVKMLGRKVKNFNSELWGEHKCEIVVRGNYAKFSQNMALRDFLINTGDAVLVEASPYDVIWGIGLDASNPDATNPAKWRGSNLLGFALMHVRDMIREDLNGLK